MLHFFLVKNFHEQFKFINTFVIVFILSFAVSIIFHVLYRKHSSKSFSFYLHFLSYYLSKEWALLFLSLDKLEPTYWLNWCFYHMLSIITTHGYAEAMTLIMNTHTYKHFCTFLYTVTSLVFLCRWLLDFQPFCFQSIRIFSEI